MKNSLETFSYCPKCGAHSFSPIDAKAMGCSICGLRYYANVASAVALIVIDKEENILSVVREREPAKGTLDLPGGFVDPMETVENAVARELFEETNLKANDIKYLFSRPNKYPYSGIDVYTSDLVFLCRVDNFGSAIANDDAAELRISKISEIRGDDYGLMSIRQIMTEIENDNNIILRHL